MRKLSQKPRTLRKELFTRFFLALLGAQLAFLAVVGAIGVWYLRTEQAQKTESKVERSVELFGNLARYGDVRYARFLVLDNAKGDGLRTFTVHDLAGEEIQAANQENAARIDRAVIALANQASLDQRRQRSARFQLLASTANSSQRQFCYLLRTVDGAEYIIAAAVLDEGLPLFWLGLGAFALILFSTALAAALAQGRLRVVIALVNRYAHDVRSMTAATGSAVVVPYSELGPVQEAIVVMVEDLRQQAAQLAEREKDAAVARMTQMLAHDVRKPFSILRMGLGMLGSAKDPAGVKNVLSRLVPEIDKAVGSVDGLIADVMEVGSGSSELIKELASPESLIEGTLGEIFRVYPKSDINVSYDLKHDHMVNVHVQKVGRVFSNIVGNAVQAMGYKGDIWFKTRERDGMVEFCVGNAGSVIPVESFPRLFDAFFTSGKKGGTGLGLAIAQKVVTAHAGKIWCESRKSPEHPDGSVEFYFTLPVAEGHLSGTTASLPDHSSKITEAFVAMADVTAAEGSIDLGEQTLEQEIILSSKNIGRPLRVLVVDDEPVYRSALTSYLSRTSELTAAIDVVPVEDANAALQAVVGDAFDLVITDVDMGQTSLDGFELVSQMRISGIKALVCVHSNRIVPADHRTAFESGADAFLPKPMARAQLLRVLLQAAKLPRPTKSSPAGPVAPAQASVDSVAPDQTEILIVDDDPFVLEAWESTLASDALVHTVSGIGALRTLIEHDQGLVSRLNYIVTDMYLDEDGDGIAVGRFVKGLRPELPVLLSSDATFSQLELIGAIDGVIGKEAVVLSELTKRWKA